MSSVSNGESIKFEIIISNIFATHGKLIIDQS